MDASRYLAFEDGYMQKIALKKGIMAPDQVRQMVLDNPNLRSRNYSSLKPEYYDMVAAKLNEDWALGALTPGTNRLLMSGGLGLAGGAAIGGLLGGGEGALIGGLLGALAGYLMDAFNIGLPDAYKKLFSARAENKMVETIDQAAAELKKNGKGSMWATTVESFRRDLPSETPIQLATIQDAIQNKITAAQKSGNVAEERKWIQELRKHKEVVRAKYKDEAAKIDTASNMGRAMAQRQAPTARVQMGKQLEALSRDVTETKLKIDERRARNFTEADLADLNKELAHRQTLFQQASDRMTKMVPGFIRGGPKWTSLSPQKEFGKLDPFQKAIGGTTSLLEAEALAGDYLDTRKKSRDFYYPKTEGGGKLDFPSLRLGGILEGDPNEQAGNVYAGLPVEHTRQQLMEWARAAGAPWVEKYETNPDGSFKFDDRGNPIQRPTLTQKYGPMTEEAGREAGREAAKPSPGLMETYGPMTEEAGREATKPSPGLMETYGPMVEEAGREAAKATVKAKSPYVSPDVPSMDPLLEDRRFLTEDEVNMYKGQRKLKPTSGFDQKGTQTYTGSDGRLYFGGLDNEGHKTQAAIADAKRTGRRPPQTQWTKTTNADLQNFRNMSQAQRQEPKSITYMNPASQGDLQRFADKVNSRRNPTIISAKPGPADAYLPNPDEWWKKNMEKKMSGSSTPMWWEVLEQKHASTPTPRNTTPMWWEVLQKTSGLPQDPGAVMPQQMQQPQGIDPNKVFDHASKVTEMKAQAALEGAKADAEIKKKQAEIQLTNNQAGIDAKNKQMDAQTNQVQQAQQQATAQNPAVNQSPQQPTAMLGQQQAQGGVPTAPVAPQPQAM